jgi:hypothetical protein
MMLEDSESIAPSINMSGSTAEVPWSRLADVRETSEGEAALADPRMTVRRLTVTSPLSPKESAAQQLERSITHASRRESVRSRRASEVARILAQYPPVEPLRPEDVRFIYLSALH